MKTKLHYLFIALALFAGVHPVLAQTTPLSIALEGNQVVLFWPTTITSYILQSTTNLASPNWVAVTNGVPLTAVSVTNTSPAMFFRLLNTTPPAGMAFIPAGAFTMGDTLDGEGDAIPISVTVSAFYMDLNLVSYSQWQTVYNWAIANGYSFDNPGSGKAANHPVQTVDWYDVVKWSNARSQQAGSATTGPHALNSRLPPGTSTVVAERTILSICRFMARRNVTMTRECRSGTRSLRRSSPCPIRPRTLRSGPLIPSVTDASGKRFGGSIIPEPAEGLELPSG